MLFLDSRLFVRRVMLGANLIADWPRFRVFKHLHAEHPQLGIGRRPQPKEGSDVSTISQKEREHRHQ
ncbi:MAG: hypothetical protein KatS3mg111_2509 [Pirellulaceae bacterium]|nr:MAG: hypothetical protein KatS3mg111_2509 [Pirellulaceae bacterium]